MQRKFRISAAAAEDLSRIVLCVQGQSLQGAALVTHRVARTMELLQQFPHAGIAYAQRPTVRKIPVLRTRLDLVYEVTDEAITIVRIFHQAQSRPPV